MSRDPRESQAVLSFSDLSKFVTESNMIEGIMVTLPKHIAAHRDFLDGPLSVEAFEKLVGMLQPDAQLRCFTGIPGVRVGNHVAPPSGGNILRRLEQILQITDPWHQHVQYEVLHPFTDGNGRSGRALWLYRMVWEPRYDPGAIRRGFLHSFYYQTLSRQRD